MLVTLTFEEVGRFWSWHDIVSKWCNWWQKAKKYFNIIINYFWMIGRFFQMPNRVIPLHWMSLSFPAHFSQSPHQVRSWDMATIPLPLSSRVHGWLPILLPIRVESHHCLDASNRQEWNARQVQHIPLLVFVQIACTDPGQLPQLLHWALLTTVHIYEKQEFSL